MSLIDNLKQLVKDYESELDPNSAFEKVWKENVSKSIDESEADSEWHECLDESDSLIEFFSNVQEYHDNKIKEVSDEFNDMEYDYNRLDEYNSILENKISDLEDQLEGWVDFNELSFKAGVKLDPKNYLDEQKIIYALKIAAKLSPSDLIEKQTA